MNFERVDPESLNPNEEYKLKSDVMDIIKRNIDMVEIVQDLTGPDSLEKPSLVVLGGYNRPEAGGEYVTQVWLVRDSREITDEHILIEYNGKSFELTPGGTRSRQTGEKMTTGELDITGFWLGHTDWNREASHQLATVSVKRFADEASEHGWLWAALKDFTD